MKYFLFKVHFFILVFLITYEYGMYRDRLFSEFAYIYLVISVVLFFFIAKVNKTISIQLDKKGLVLSIIFLSFGLFSSILNKTLLSGFILTVGQSLLFFAFYFTYKLVNRYKQEYIMLLSDSLISLGLISFIVAIILIIYGSISFGSIEIVSTNSYRIVGWYGSSNRMGAVFGAAIIALIYKRNTLEFKTLSKKKRIFNLIYILITFLGLLLTGSRGSWLSTIFGILIFYSLNISFKKMRYRKLLSIVIGFFFILIATFFFAREMGYSFDIIIDEFVREEHFQTQLSTDAEGGRAYIINESFKFLRASDFNNILWGHGNSAIINKFGFSTHNGFLSLFIDYGIVCFVVFAYFIYYIIKLARRRKQYTDCFSLSMLGMILVKNLTNADWPGYTFTGILFINIVLLIIVRKSYS